MQGTGGDALLRGHTPARRQSYFLPLKTTVRTHELHSERTPRGYMDASRTAARQGQPTGVTLPCTQKATRPSTRTGTGEITPGPIPYSGWLSQSQSTAHTAWGSIHGAQLHRFAARCATQSLNCRVWWWRRLLWYHLLRPVYLQLNADKFTGNGYGSRWGVGWLRQPMQCAVAAARRW